MQASFKDHLKNTRTITVIDDNVLLHNQHNINLSLSNLSYLIKPADRKNIKGKAAETSYLKNLFLTAAKKSKSRNDFIEQINTQLVRSIFA